MNSVRTGLDLEDHVHEIWEEFFPYGMGGPTDHQDMFNGVLWSVTKVTGRAQVGLVESKSLVTYEVTRQEFEVLPNFLFLFKYQKGILGGILLNYVTRSDATIN